MDNISFVSHMSDGSIQLPIEQEVANAADHDMLLWMTLEEQAGIETSLEVLHAETQRSSQITPILD